MTFYVAKMVIPGRVCACKDAMKGVKKDEKEWLSGKWAVRGRARLTYEDLQNEKYFEKWQH